MSSLGDFVALTLSLANYDNNEHGLRRIREWYCTAFAILPCSQTTMITTRVWCRVTTDNFTLCGAVFKVKMTKQCKYFLQIYFPSTRVAQLLFLCRVDLEKWATQWGIWHILWGLLECFFHFFVTVKYAIRKTQNAIWEATLIRDVLF